MSVFEADLLAEPDPVDVKSVDKKSTKREEQAQEHIHISGLGVNVEAGVDNLEALLVEISMWMMEAMGNQVDILVVG